MAITAGTRLGPYEVIAPLGSGGMGEVWRGRDTRLERSVAIKVLPGEFSEDAQLKVRFEREAKTISQLNHPHICTLYDVGDNYLVMELLEGDTLADRIAKGPLPLDQVIRYGIEIAEALEKAHKAGVVHRDLKPGNIMLTKSGAKLLDFGLAKPTEGGAIAALTSLRTEKKNLTEEGTIVGTFQYMAPEQVEGAAVDARTDIFAFGAVLYEMVTGRRAFEGKSKASLIASILTVDPQPITSTQPLTPAALDRVVRMCLKKDPDDRWQSAHDVGAELRWLAESQPVARIARSSRSAYIAWTVAALLAAATIASALLWRREVEVKRSAAAVRTMILPPDKTVFDFAPFGAPPAVSPDGRRIVFGAIEPGKKRMLWLRSLESVAAQPIGGTEDALFPFWSPDGRYIAFFTETSLRKVEASGGASTQICDVSEARGGSWSPDGQTIIFAGRTTPIYRVPAAGGTPVAVTAVGGNEQSHRWPEFLPDGRHFLFLAALSGGEDPQNTVCIGSIDGKLRKPLLGSTNEPHYIDGALVFAREHFLMAQRFDPKTLTLVGEPVALREQQVQATPLMSRTMTTVAGGTLVYQPGIVSRNTRLVWFDRAKQVGVLGDEAPYAIVEISPNQKSVMTSYAGPQVNLWAFDLVRGIKTRVTFDNQRDMGPVFSPDSKRIAYMVLDRGRYHLHVKDLSTGADQDLISGETNGIPVVTSWSPDGQNILFTMQSPSNRSDIMRYSLSEQKIYPYLTTPNIENAGRFSPDGKWVLYQSTESGTTEVYVAPFPATGAKWQVSFGGGTVPRWRGDGKEIFYMSNPRPRLAMMAVPVSLAASPEFGRPVPLFEFALGWISIGAYDVTRDGQKFLVNCRSGDDLPPQPIVVVQHFDNELRAVLGH